MFWSSLFQRLDTAHTTVKGLSKNPVKQVCIKWYDRLEDPILFLLDSPSYVNDPGRHIDGFDIRTHSDDFFKVGYSGQTSNVKHSVVVHVPPMFNSTAIKKPNKLNK